jgi:hypothetical protein
MPTTKARTAVEVTRHLLLGLTLVLHHGTVGAQESASVPAARCCFEEGIDTSTYLPDLGEPLQATGPASAIIACGESQRSQLHRRYKAGAYEYDVRVFDYCREREQLAATIASRQSSAKKADTFQPITEPGSARGFAAFFKKNRSVYAHVTVDDRFLVTVQGVNSDDFAALLDLYRKLPLASLEQLER